MQFNGKTRIALSAQFFILLFRKVDVVTRTEGFAPGMSEKSKKKVSPRKGRELPF